MASQEQSEPSRKQHQGFVPVLVARSRSEAYEYCQLFTDHDIPAIVGDEESEEVSGPTRPVSRGSIGGVPVLVEEDMLDEAKEIVADREDLEEFQTDNSDELDDDDEDFHFVVGIGDEIDEDEDLIHDDQDDGAGQKEDTS